MAGKAKAAMSGAQTATRVGPGTEPGPETQDCGLAERRNRALEQGRARYAALRRYQDRPALKQCPAPDNAPDGRNETPPVPDRPKGDTQ